MKATEPRAHHFNPQCWLAGFTETGQKDGRLWVTDLKRRKQWASSPPNAGHRRDFYRATDPALDPIVFEKAFGKIETEIAPILKSLYENQRGPTNNDELESILYFAAIQYIRVPSFRPVVLRIADSLHKSWIAKALRSPAAWAKALRKAGIPPDTPGADYSKMLQFQRKVIDTGEYTLSAENEWYLIRGFKAVLDAIIPSLSARYWNTVFSKSGVLIGSDNPVVMDGDRNRLIGFKSAGVVLIQLNRYALLLGTNLPAKLPTFNGSFIASLNTFAMLTAQEHLYSHSPNICWLDETGICQTDWKLFSKEKVLGRQ
jgi:hypothetical protein